VSVKTMAWVWDHSRTEGTARLVLLAIADHAGHDGRDAYPSQDTIAQKCRVSVRTVRRAIGQAVALGELAVEEHGGVGSGAGRKTHRYSFPMLGDNLTANPAGGLGDSLTANPGGVGGHPGQVGGQPRQGCRTPGVELGDTGVRGTIQNHPEPSEPSTSPASGGALVLVAPIADPVRVVFDEWVRITERTPRTHLDSKRRKLIDRALDTYGLDEIVAAVRGWRWSPHHAGHNDRGTVYNDLELLLRDAQHIERFRDLELSQGTAGRAPILPKGAGAVAAAVRAEAGR